MRNQRISRRRGVSTTTHCVTPPKLLSTTKAVILSFISPVLGSFTGVLANTVKISASPPLLSERGQVKTVRRRPLVAEPSTVPRPRRYLIQILLPFMV